MADLYSLYQGLFPAEQRTYAESLGKAFTGRTNVPITEKNYSPEELATIKELIAENYKKKVRLYTDKDYLTSEIKAEEERKKTLMGALKAGKLSKEDYQKQLVNIENRVAQYQDAMKGKLPSDFRFDYSDYYPESVYGSEDKSKLDKYTSIRNTLGNFRYKVDPKTNKINIYDTYDFSNPSRQANVDKYASMSAAQKALQSARAFVGGDVGSLGEAYLGKQGVPVSINLDMDDAMLTKYKK